MSLLTAIRREFAFLLKQNVTVALILSAALLSSFAVWSGLSETAEQNAAIERLLEADADDRAAAIAKEVDYGGAAYYAFHLTYDPPSALAFAALGERDVRPWKHRIRMLALEGQIYETDAGNAELAHSGRFDFAFVISVLAPLFLIILLHDQRASERAAGRHDLLAATAGSDHAPWRARAGVRVAGLTLALLAPFWVGAMIAGVSLHAAILVTLIATLLIVFWTAICLWASARRVSGPAIASSLLAVWVLTTFVIPALGDAAIRTAVPAPKGGDIILAQREKVNDAWDIPKEATMDPFLERHPEWADHADINRPFEWKWYYAFQQVGDQSVEEMSLKRREAVAARNEAAGWVALLSPAGLTERALTRAARTDAKAAFAYQESVRAFHASLRAFHYPLLFGSEPYDEGRFDSLPEYKPSF